jgi:hypothetical protein
MRGSWRRRVLIGSTVVAASASAVLASGATAAPDRCPTAWNLLTIEQTLESPQSLLAYERGYIDRATLRAIYETVDENDNGMFCVHVPPGWALSAEETRAALIQIKDDRLQ